MLITKGLSVITNFGCKSNCEYCIWKNTINYIKYQFYNHIHAQLFSLKSFLIQHPDIEKFSLSGGGDPLNLTTTSLNFYKNLNNICYELNKKYDIHTSYFINDIEKFLNVTNSDTFLRKIVYHASLDRIPEPILLKEFKKLEKNFDLRIVYVITDSLTIEYLNQVEEILKNNFKNIQLSYREYVGTKYLPSKHVKEFCKNVSKRLKNSRFIEQNDYNYYIMPDGSITEKFLEKGLF